MSGTTRTRRTTCQWRELIDEQVDSGLSQVAFCKRKRIALSSFANWKRKLSAASSEQKSNTPDPSTWIDLGSLGAERSGWDIELDLGGGVCLRLRRG